MSSSLVLPPPAVAFGEAGTDRRAVNQTVDTQVYTQGYYSRQIGTYGMQGSLEDAERTFHAGDCGLAPRLTALY